MHHIRSEFAKIAPDSRRNRDRHQIFSPLEHWNRGDADEVAGWRERRVLDGRRIDTHVHALAKEVANEAVQCLVGAVTDVIVIARKEGDAEVAGLHADGL